MSHEISIQNGVAEMGYVAGTARWHGLGNELPEGASIDEWKKRSGMQWRVLRSKVRYAVERDYPSGALDNMRTWDEQHVLFRSDTKAPLAVVSDGYKVVQPGEALEFFRDLCEHNHFKMRTAGVLFGGRRYWALADIGEESYVMDPRDRVKGRLLLATACDTSMKSVAKFVAECVVCNNTLSMARAEGGKQIAVSHRSVFNASDVKAKLGLAAGQWNLFIKQARMLAARKVSDKDVENFVFKLMGHGATPIETMTDEQRAEILAYRHTKAILAKYTSKGIAHDMPGRSGTAWGLVNAVTEYVDHDLPARTQDNRFNSSQFGPGDEMKSRAMELAVAMV